MADKKITPKATTGKDAKSSTPAATRVTLRKKRTLKKKRVAKKK